MEATATTLPFSPVGFQPNMGVASPFVTPNAGVQQSVVSPTPTSIPAPAYYQPIFTQPAPVNLPQPQGVFSDSFAKTIPLGGVPTLPKPNEIAPCVFTPHVPYQTGVAATANAGSYQYPTGNAMPWASPPASAPPPPTPPAAKPVQPPPEPAVQPLPPPPANPRGSLTEQERNEIFTGMQSSDDNTRMQAAQTLARVLKKDPNVLSKPGIGEEVEALIVNVLSDANAMTRQPLLVAMEAGNLKNPTPRIIEALEKLQGQNGLYNFEPVFVGNILGKFQAEQAAPKAPATQALVAPEQTAEKTPALSGGPLPDPVTMGANPALMQQYLAAANQAGAMAGAAPTGASAPKLNVMSG